MLQELFRARFFGHPYRSNGAKIHLDAALFMMVYEVIIKWYLNFITCLYFPLVLIKWNSSHCHLMELFKIKESFKEKIDSNNNWKTAWPKMILEWHLFVRLSLRFVWKMLSFVGKHLSFYPNDVCVCSFSLFFYLNKKELNQQVCLMRNTKRMRFLTLPLTEKRETREEQKHIQLQKHQF